MAFTLIEARELELLKLDHKVKLIDLNNSDRAVEHAQKINRLKLMLEIAKAGGVNRNGSD